MKRPNKGPTRNTSNSPAINQPDLWAFTSHGSPTWFARGSDVAARQLAAFQNTNRATNPVIAQPITAAANPETEPIFVIQDILEESMAAVQAVHRSILHRPNTAQGN